MAVVRCKNSHFYDNEKFDECPHCARLAAGESLGSVPAALEAQQAGEYAAEYIRKNSADALMGRQRQEEEIQSDANWQQEEDGSWSGEAAGSGANWQQEEDGSWSGEAVGSGANWQQEEDGSWSGEADTGGAGWQRKETVEEKKIAGRNRESPGCTVGWLVCVKGEDYGRDFSLYAGFNRVGRGGGNDILLSDPKISREEHFSVVYERKKNVFYIIPKAGNLVYVEEELVGSAQELKHGQRISVGETELEFAAFCIGEKKW